MYDIQNMRAKKSDLKPELQNKTIKTFFDAALHAQENGRVVGFLKGILTESEQLMLGRRLLAARMLLSGLPQNEIRLRLGLSPNTLWKINRWLVEQIPEYETVLKKVEKEVEERKVKRGVSKHKRMSYNNYDPLSFAAFKRRYPMHFLLFNLAEEVINSFKKK
jgi:uncharacterized protein YerC